MYILTHTNLLPSVKALRDDIFKLSRVKMDITVKYPTSGKVAIRWGNSISGNGERDGRLNSAELVHVMANKKAFSNKYKDNFWVPIFYQREPNPNEYPILIRTIMEGMGGAGIFPVKNPREFKQKWVGPGYWTPYINLVSEFRVHVFDGEVLRIMKKVREEGTPETDFNIRNSSRGWHFSPMENANLGKLRSVAKEFWNVTKRLFKVEHGFFALDVGWNPEKKEYFILEGNSAPGIKENPNTRMLYARKFVQVLELH